MNPYGS
jgi:hypothetical protein